MNTWNEAYKARITNKDLEVEKYQVWDVQVKTFGENNIEITKTPVKQ